MNFYDVLISFYRKALKRIPGVHRGNYIVMSKVLLPALEAALRFKTIPDDPLNFRLALLLKTYEPETVDFVQKTIKPGMTVLDIGAHVGYYTRIFSDLVGPCGRVFAFEPHPFTYPYLHKNMKTTHNVTTFNLALGKERDERILYDALPESAGSSLALHSTKREHVASKIINEIAQRARRGQPIRAFKVKLERGDDILKVHDVKRIDFIKLDVEGAEIEVMNGLKETIRNSPGCTLVIELAPTNLKSFGYTVDDLLQTLDNLGFESLGILRVGGIVSLSGEAVRHLAVDLEHRFAWVNMVCFRR